MQVVLHIGAHCTDEDRLVRCLLKNRDLLHASGVVVPGPGRYRALLRETLASLAGREPGPEVPEMLLDAVMDEDEAARLVLSNEYFLGIHQQAATPDGLYPAAGRRIAALAGLFPEAEVEVHMALRNPATLVPALMARMKPEAAADVAAIPPETLDWAAAVARIREETPDLALTLWCNEDSPLIWPELLRSLAGIAAAEELEGERDFLAALLTPEGAAELAARLDARPAPAARAEIAEDLLARFAREEEVEMEVALPGWTEDRVDALTEAYEADCARIAAMPGVRFLMP